MHSAPMLFEAPEAFLACRKAAAHFVLGGELPILKDKIATL
jgi:hypothetical protein